MDVTQRSSSGSVHPTATSDPLWPPVICCMGTVTAWLPLGLLMAMRSSSGTGVTAAVSGAGYSATRPPNGATAALMRSVGCTSPKSRLQRSVKVKQRADAGTHAVRQVCVEVLVKLLLNDCDWMIRLDETVGCCCQVVLARSLAATRIAKWTWQRESQPEILLDGGGEHMCFAWPVSRAFPNWIAASAPAKAPD